jgi:hypothetical protein
MPFYPLFYGTRVSVRSRRCEAQIALMWNVLRIPSHIPLSKPSLRTRPCCAYEGCFSDPITHNLQTVNNLFLIPYGGRCGEDCGNSSQEAHQHVARCAAKPPGADVYYPGGLDAFHRAQVGRLRLPPLTPTVGLLLFGSRDAEPRAPLPRESAGTQRAPALTIGLLLLESEWSQNNECCTEENCSNVTTCSETEARLSRRVSFRI